jgi:hypothetical protein
MKHAFLTLALHPPTMPTHLPARLFVCAVAAVASLPALVSAEEDCSCVTAHWTTNREERMKAMPTLSKVFWGEVTSVDGDVATLRVVKAFKGVQNKTVKVRVNSCRTPGVGQS